MTFVRSYTSRCATLLVALAAAAAVVSVPAHAQAPGDYRIVDGKVDEGTYWGWRVFHASCQSCHGIDAVGTTVAPNLLERVRTMTPRAFVTKVLTSYSDVVIAHETTANHGTSNNEARVDEVMQQERRARGQIVMPAWEDDPIVGPLVLDVFAYLLARADGKLGPGQPVRLVQPKRRPKP